MARQTRPPQERLVDLAAFFIGFAAFARWVGTDDSAQGPLAGRHLAAGEKMARRYIPQMTDQLVGLEPTVSEFTSVMPAYRRAVRRQAPIEMGKAQAAFFSIFLLRLSKRVPLMRDTFPGRSLRVAMRLSQAAQAEAPESLLAACAGLVPLSGLRVTKTWLRRAAELAGVAPTEIETVVQDAQVAADLASEVRKIDQKLLVADPMTPEAVELQDEKAAKLADIQAVADESPRPDVVLAHAVKQIAAEPQFEHATKTGQAQTLSPDQEDAMMVQGRAIIAAGAGSGKTRVIAAKVVYHIKELGLDPAQIMATSFSRKSAAELLARINRYGGDISGDAASGFGTTHSIAGKLLHKNKAGRQGGGLKSYETKTLVRLAMEQVMMPGGENIAVPPAQGILEGLFQGPPAGSDGAPAAPQPVVPESMPTVGVTFVEALTETRDAHRQMGRGGFRNGYYRWLGEFLESFFNPRDRWYSGTMRKTDNLRDPRGLSQKQKDNVWRAMKLHNVDYHPKRDPNLAAEYTKQGSAGGFWESLPKAAAVAPPSAKTKGQRKQDDRLRRKYPSFSEPVGAWFNRNLDLTEAASEGEGEGKQHDRAKQKQKRKLMAPGQFAMAISQFKGKMVSPTEAWHQAQAGEGVGEMPSAFAAVYAAYEHLKGNDGEREFRGKGDFDDVLIDASKLMLRNPRVLRQVQSQYKCVLVDEAQDLNRCVSGDTEVQTPEGPKSVRNVQAGERVLSFVNGQIVYNRVLEKVPSDWARGYRVHLVSGETLLMSPNHRIYATPLDGCPEGQLALYLMYKEGMGFRMGTTARMFQNRATSSGRATQEVADCAWVLEMGDPQEILFKEQALSLEHGIPTYVFVGSSRGCNQERINLIFERFGERGRALLAEYDLHFEYPHWLAQAATRGAVDRQVVNLCAHRGKGRKNVQRGSSVSMNWTGAEFDCDIPTYTTKGGRKMIGKLSSDYGTARRVAEHVAERSGAFLSETLWLEDQKLPLLTASALLPGMRLPVWQGGVDLGKNDLLPIAEYKGLATRLEVSLEGVGGSRNTGKREIHMFLREEQLRRGISHPLPPVEGAKLALVEIEAVEVVEGGDFWDLAVENAHNFFGNGVLSHNSQHVMFGLISGYLDPAKVHEIGTTDKVGSLARDDGKMTADTYAFIGDDKQAIYEFRGADPEVFIDMSDLVEGGAGFETKILDMNYRSGSDIVEAANALIAHNSKQIPMTCKANKERRGTGRITSELFGSTKDGAEFVASQIEEMSADDSLELSAGDFGVALRTNSEAYSYGLEMIKRGIPFKSKANFFNDKNTKALIYWLQLADEGVHGDVKRINEAVKNCVGAPKSFLGKAFQDGLEDHGRGNLLQWLADGGTAVFGRSSRNAQKYLDNLLIIARGSFEDGTAALDAVMGLAGSDGTTIEDALLERIMDDEEAMAELAAESDDGVVSEEAVMSRALAPIDPLTGLLESRESIQGSMEYVRQLRSANEKLSSKDDADTIEVPAVTISTMHGWKGLEVPHLYVPMRGAGFPRPAAEEEDLASERRLAYVALTRGASAVTVLDIPMVTKKGKVIHSRFIEEACIRSGGTPRGASKRAYTEEEMDAALRGDTEFFDRLYGIVPEGDEETDFEGLPKAAEISEATELPKAAEAKSADSIVHWVPVPILLPEGAGPATLAQVPPLSNVVADESPSALSDLPAAAPIEPAPTPPDVWASLPPVGGAK